MSDTDTDTNTKATSDSTETDDCTLEGIHAQLNALTDRVAELEDELERKDDRIDELESTVDRQDALLEALRRKTGGTREMVSELQSRELEKHAHLRWENVDRNIEDLSIDTDHVEKFTKDDGQTYVRIPGGKDPLGRGGDPALTPGDLLPIQQFARMDEDMLHSAASSKPIRLAAEVWRDRTQERSALWNEGCNSVRAYLDVGELAQWLRYNEAGVNKDYSRNLASRTIDALVDLTNGRLYVKRKNRRKDGLSYKERRVILPRESEIPGETTPSELSAPKTADVSSD